MKCSSNILCLHTFLLLCGDISKNPGPVRHPCGACSKPVRANQHGLQCECCDTWSHRVCVNMTKPEYQRLGNSWESWFCETCLLPQFTDSFFSVDQSINSSYLPSTTNSSLHEDLVLNISGNTTEGGGEENYDPFMELRKVRHKHKNNVLVSYLNINSLRYKLTEISDVLYDKLTDICFFAETKLDITFNDNLFNIPQYKSFLNDRNSSGGGLIAYVRSNLPARRRHYLEFDSPIETIVLDIQINNRNNRKWAIIGAYRPPSHFH